MVGTRPYRFLALIGGPGPRTVFVTIAGVGLWRAGRRAEAIFLAGTVGATGAVNSAIKRAVGRRRPRRFRVPAEHDSFPSGHTSGTWALTGASAYLVWRAGLGPAVTAASVLAAAVVSGIMGYSRVRLRRHHPGDVVGGIGLGTVGLTAGIGALARWSPRRDKNG